MLNNHPEETQFYDLTTQKARPNYGTIIFILS